MVFLHQELQLDLGLFLTLIEKKTQPPTNNLEKNRPTQAHTCSITWKEATSGESYLPVSHFM